MHTLLPFTRSNDVARKKQPKSEVLKPKAVIEQLLKGEKLTLKHLKGSFFTEEVAKYVWDFHDQDRIRAAIKTLYQDPDAKKAYGDILDQDLKTLWFGLLLESKVPQKLVAEPVKVNPSLIRLQKIPAGCQVGHLFKLDNP